MCDEGVWPSSFKVFEADTRLDIAHHIHRNPEPWVWWLEKSKVWRPSREEQDCPPPEVLLRRIDASSMDGSSTWAFRIHEVRSVEAIPHHTAPHPDG